MSTLSDYDAIVAVVERYAEGSLNGDAAMLRGIFHADARMFGYFNERSLDLPIGAYIDRVDGKPIDVNGSYKASVTRVEQIGDVAIATLVEEGAWGTVSFVDHFSLARINGSWKIVNKIFHHTGGKPPG